MSGWIKLNRKILDWQWYDNNNTFKLFIHLLLKSNIESKKWHKEEVKRGQLITSIEHLSKETGLTYQQTRTAISNLKTTGELTIKSTNRFSLITIVNYSSYQDKSTEATDKTTGDATNKQQSNNKQITTTKEYKNYKEYKEERKKKEVTKKFSDEAFSLTQYLYDNIMKKVNPPTYKNKLPKLESWASDIDKLIRVDGQDYNTITQAIDYATSDTFWQSNILSGAKLRKHFDKLIIASKKKCGFSNDTLKEQIDELFDKVDKAKEKRKGEKYAN